MASTAEINLPVTALGIPVPRAPLVSKRRAVLALGVLTSVLVPVIAFRGVNLADAGVHDAELKAAGLLALAGAIGLACLLVAGYRGRRRFARALSTPAAWVSPTLADKVEELAGRFLDGLNVFGSPVQVLKVLGL